MAITPSHLITIALCSESSQTLSSRLLIFVFLQPKKGRKHIHPISQFGMTVVWSDSSKHVPNWNCCHFTVANISKPFKNAFRSLKHLKTSETANSFVKGPENVPYDRFWASSSLQAHGITWPSYLRVCMCSPVSSPVSRIFHVPMTKAKTGWHSSLLRMNIGIFVFPSTWASPAIVSAWIHAHISCFWMSRVHHRMTLTFFSSCGS